MNPEEVFYPKRELTQESRPTHHEADRATASANRRGYPAFGCAHSRVRVKNARLLMNSFGSFCK